MAPERPNDGLDRDDILNTLIENIDEDGLDNQASTKLLKTFLKAIARWERRISDFSKSAEAMAALTEKVDKLTAAFNAHQKSMEALAVNHANGCPTCPTAKELPVAKTEMATLRAEIAAVKKDRADGCASCKNVQDSRLDLARLKWQLALLSGISIIIGTALAQSVIKWVLQ